jgi:hypothetical protein
MSALVVQSIRQAHPYAQYFGLLHIRRGDEISSCDTSLERMSYFLSCSLKGMEAFGNITLLLASDEQDLCYRNAIADIIQGLGHGFLDLDSTIGKTVKDYVAADTSRERLLNNFFVYQVSVAMRAHQALTFHLEQRRVITCPDCTPLLENPTFQNRSRMVAEPRPATVMGFAQVEKTYLECRA